MSAISARGTQAKENANKGNVDIKDIYLRLKDGESHKVRILGAFDYVEYQASGDYNLGIYNQPISNDSPLLVAHAKGGEKFKNLYKKSRYVFVFASIETGKLVAWDASKTQAKTLISTIEEYADVLDEVGFNFKRVGNKTETVYSLNPIIKLKGTEADKFAEFEGQTVSDQFFEDIIQIKTPEFLAKLLKEAGFDVETHLPHIQILEDSQEASTQINPEEQSDNLLDHI